MIVGIDASSANKDKRTGVEWYAFHLIQEMKKQALAPEDRVLLYSPTALTGELAALPAQWESKVLKWSVPTGWMQGRVSWEMLKRPPNVLFVPAQGLPKVIPRYRQPPVVPLRKGDALANSPPARGGARGGGSSGTVTTIHDVGFRRRPDLYEPATRKRLEKVTKDAVKRAAKIFVPTEFTKSELAELFHAKAEQLVVTPEAADLSRYKPLPEADVQVALQKYRLGRKLYFLCVGRIEAKKNIGTLIRAFEIFKAGRGMGDPFELVLAGSPGFGFETIKKYYDLSPAKSFIKNLGYVDEADVPTLMNGAYAYLFPSWYEGFGIPNLEAMACGVPLVTSNIGAHKEVAGEAALFVSPSEPEAWATAMRRVTEDARLVGDLVAKGLARAQQFTWAKTAQITWQTLRGLVS
jgi:glycosyltransferase involved in cell wall biosynthesis